MTPEQQEMIDARIGGLECQALEAAAQGQHHQASAIYERLAGMAEVLAATKATESAARAEEAMASTFTASISGVQLDPWAMDPEQPHH